MIAFLGKEKPAAREAFAWLADRTALAKWYQRHEDAPQDALIVSFLYPRRLPPGGINFHPAPLPAYRGVCPYTFAILNAERVYGVTAHHIASDIDTGPIIDQISFPMDPDSETASSLEIKSVHHLVDLFRRVMGRVLRGEELPRIEQGPGRYYSMADFEAARRIQPGDDVERKVRAFSHPDHPGAYR